MEFVSEAIGAALIAGGASLLGLLITKQSKTSEFRQEWINSLREEIATIIQSAFTIHEANEDSDAVDKAFAEVHKATSLVSLRLNPKEKETATILSAMNGLREVIHKTSTFSEVSHEVDKLTAATQVVLKKEWKRVKVGERTYRLASWLLLVVTLVLLALFLFQHHEWFDHYPWTTNKVCK